MFKPVMGRTIDLYQFTDLLPSGPARMGALTLLCLTLHTPQSVIQWRRVSLLSVIWWSCSKLSAIKVGPSSKYVLLGNGFDG